MYEANVSSQQRKTSSNWAQDFSTYDLGSGAPEQESIRHTKFSIHSLIFQGKFPHSKHVNIEGKWEGNWQSFRTNLLSHKVPKLVRCMMSNLICEEFSWDLVRHWDDGRNRIDFSPTFVVFFITSEVSKKSPLIAQEDSFISFLP